MMRFKFSSSLQEGLIVWMEKVKESEILNKTQSEFYNGLM